MTLPRSLITVALFVTTATALSAQERKIGRRDLPAAVARTAATESKGAKVRGYSQEKENGQTYYEVKLTVKGHHRDVLIDSTGTVVEVEEQVKLADVPAAVRDSLKAAVGKGKVTGVESVTKGGRVVAYEARVNTNGKRSEVSVDPDGKRITGEP
jgi:hypothetical protein